MTVKFLKCSICGNIVGLIQDGGGELVCCGKPMQELVANTEDAAQEKHVPVITVDGSTVRVAVGSVEHPMIEKHYIQWIYLQTTHGGQRYILKPVEAGGCFRSCRGCSSARRLCLLQSARIVDGKAVTSVALHS